MGKSQEKDVSCVNECHRSLSKMIACVEQSREILILILIDFIIFLLFIYTHTNFRICRQIYKWLLIHHSTHQHEKWCSVFAHHVHMPSIEIDLSFASGCWARGKTLIFIYGCVSFMWLCGGNNKQLFIRIIINSMLLWPVKKQLPNKYAQS